MPRGIQDSSKREFIKKGKDSSSIERCKCIKMTLAEKNREGKRSPKVHSIKRWNIKKEEEEEEEEEEESPLGWKPKRAV